MGERRKGKLESILNRMKMKTQLIKIDERGVQGGTEGERLQRDNVLSEFLWFYKNMNTKIDQIVPFKYVKLYPLNMYSLLYVNYSSTKLFLKSHWKVDAK